jgi:hypothetical protein
VSTRREEKALASVVSEVRAERPPELDWAKIEATLDALPPPEPAPKRSPLRHLVPPMALAAAAAVAYFAWPAPPVEPVAERATATDIAKPANGDALAPGSLVEAREEKRVVSHAQRTRSAPPGRSSRGPSWRSSGRGRSSPSASSRAA